jgi:hypothetical protein
MDIISAYREAGMRRCDQRHHAQDGEAGDRHEVGCGAPEGSLRKHN